MGEGICLQHDVDAARTSICRDEPLRACCRQLGGRRPLSAERSGRTGGVGDGRVTGEFEREDVQLLECDWIERVGARGQRDVELGRGERAGWKAASQELEAADGLCVAQALKLIVVGAKWDQACYQHRRSPPRRSAVPPPAGVSLCLPALLSSRRDRAGPRQPSPPPQRRPSPAGGLRTEDRPTPAPPEENPGTGTKTRDPWAAAFSSAEIIHQARRAQYPATRCRLISA